MKHKEYILIGVLYLLSPFIGQLLVENTHFIGTEFTATAYIICWLSASTIYQKMYCLSMKNQIRNLSSK